MFKVESNQQGPFGFITIERVKKPKTKKFNLNDFLKNTHWEDVMLKFIEKYSEDDLNDCLEAKNIELLDDHQTQVYVSSYAFDVIELTCYQYLNDRETKQVHRINTSEADNGDSLYQLLMNTKGKRSDGV